MFLTKKSFRKIIIMAAAYFVLGGFAILLDSTFKAIGVGDGALFIIGVIAFAAGALFALLGYYVEGEGKLINLGNRLIRKELRPAQFIKEYESLKNSCDLVVNKPSFDVLLLVVLAYDCLDDQEKCLAAMDEMISVAKGKKKNRARLFKASVLFAYGQKEEAQALLVEIQGQKLGVLSTAMMDIIIKTDRAMAMGDYETAKAYYLQMLENESKKSDNYAKLAGNYKLGEIYEKLNDKEKALTYYKYCAENGGETAIRPLSVSALERLSQIRD